MQQPCMCRVVRSIDQRNQVQRMGLVRASAPLTSCSVCFCCFHTSPHICSTTHALRSLSHLGTFCQFISTHTCHQASSNTVAPWTCDQGSLQAVVTSVMMPHAQPCHKVPTCFDSGGVPVVACKLFHVHFAFLFTPDPHYRPSCLSLPCHCPARSMLPPLPSPPPPLTTGAEYGEVKEERLGHGKGKSSGGTPIPVVHNLWLCPAANDPCWLLTQPFLNCPLTEMDKPVSRKAVTVLLDEACTSSRSSLLVKLPLLQ